MTVAKTLLDELRAQSCVDCDTLDPEVGRTLGPFVDCTCNQAIAYGELQKAENEKLILEAVHLAKKLHALFEREVGITALAVEIMMVMLSARMLPYLTGYAHIQTDPKNAYSAEKTIGNASRIIHLFSLIAPTHPPSRICIKIPATHPGLVACSALESQSVATLATTLFSPLQTALAAHAGCTYIAPYINELPVHFEAGRVDTDPGFEVARAAQRGFERGNKKTKVLCASLVNIGEVMKLGGCAHITVSPPLLRELAATASSSPGGTTSSASLWFLEDEEKVEEEEERKKADAELEELVRDEAAWTYAFTRGKGGADAKKLIDAINIFADMQEKMEEMARMKMGVPV